MIEKNKTTKKIKIVELFGGIGAVRKALIKQNIPHEVIDYVEPNEWAVKAYNSLYFENFKPKDIKNYKLPNKKIDLLVHTSLCQDFSKTEHKKIDEQIERLIGTYYVSHLWEIFRIVQEAKYKPEIILWENSKKILNKKYKPVLDMYIKELKKLGYQSVYKVLNSSDFGIPQDRERTFCISFLDKPSSFNLNFKKQKMKNINEFVKEGCQDEKYLLNFKKSPSIVNGYFNKKVKLITDKTKAIPTKWISLHHIGVFKEEIPFYKKQEIENHFKFVNATEKDKSIYKLYDNDIFFINNEPCYLRVLKESECLALMGFDDWDFKKINALSIPKKELYKLAGNSIVVDVLEAIFKRLNKRIWTE
ncbi:DNA cytosine methyltransferase [Mycoplasma tauri]|uniref:DNA cytosine methyltransferase n=1 Tax=Mycoplasma tauri TaxID=547987 RepID=UPI001CBD7E32|nr:DNA (cytosine-5-)-methyltransferase [Mycoplasma tauri]MBZ4204464.1 DNA (cytosine-5-)-methyltransferase [Mycoplasma tauri]MBZ4226750.1 DNA (cytosine-5-)-methyltransferase [Mycoplasma tauri]